MATRFEAQSVGIKGTSYTVAIDDSSFAGSATDIEIRDGFRILYDPDSQDDPASPIIASSCTFTINILPSYRTAANTFISDMLDADEGRFMVKITSSGGSIFWAGYILTDQIQHEDEDWADVVSAFTIRAVDGISRLKDIDYNDNGTPYTGRVLLKEHLFNVLDKIGTGSFYGATDTFFIAICRWYDANMGATTADNPYDLTYADHDAFYEKDGNGNYEYKSHYDVLKQLAQLFFCRFYYSNGAYRMDQVSEYPEATVVRHFYYSDGTKSGNPTQSIKVTENSDDILRKGEGAAYLYFAPARKVKLTYRHRNDRNYIAGSEWSNVSGPTVSLPGVGRDGIRLWVTGRFLHFVDFVPDSDFGRGLFRFYFQITASVDGTTYYLKRDYSLNGASGYTYLNAQWTTNASDVFYYWSSPNEIESVTFSTDIEFETPELPGSGELAYVTIDVNYQGYFKYTNGGALGLAAPSNVIWSFSNASLQLTADDDAALTEETILYQSNGDAPNASLLLEYDTILADAPSAYFLSTNSITIEDGGGAPGIVGGNWGKGAAGGSQRIQYLWLEELMNFRQASLRRYEGVLLGSDFLAHNKVQLYTTAEQYVILRGEYDSYNELWTGDFFFVGIGAKTVVAPDQPVHSRGPNQPKVGAGPGPKYAPGGNPAGIPDPVAQARPTGGHVATTTDGPIAADTPTTSIPIEPTCAAADNLIAAGDTIVVYDPITGNSYSFTASADVAGTDTSISVSSATPDVALSDGSLVIIDTCSFVGNIRAGVQCDCGNSFNVFTQSFTMNGTDNSVTITVNGGTLPTDSVYIDVWYDATPIFETDAWTKSGSNINLTFTPEAGSVIRVKFYIISSTSITRYEQSFSGTSRTKTITANSGVLPANTAQIDVWYDATPIFEADGYNVSGSDIILTFTPEASATVRVKFWI